MEPTDYQILACYLSASPCVHFGDQVALAGCCPDLKMDLLDPKVKELLRRMNCDVGNNAVNDRHVATPKPHDPEFSAVTGSDALGLRAKRVKNDIKDSHVPMILDDLDIWGKSFPERWMPVAKQINACPEVPGKRTYSGQISLPPVNQTSGFMSTILPEEQNVFQGGRMRGKPLIADHKIFTSLDRRLNDTILDNLSETTKGHVQKHAGAERIRNLEPIENV